MLQRAANALGTRSRLNSDFVDALSERERAGDDGARRGAADKIEPVAEPDLAAHPLVKKLFDALEGRDRDRAAHPAAIEREDPFWPRAEHMIVARTGIVVVRVAHRSRDTMTWNSSPSMLS